MGKIYIHGHRLVYSDLTLSETHLPQVGGLIKKEPGLIGLKKYLVFVISHFRFFFFITVQHNRTLHWQRSQLCFTHMLPIMLNAHKASMIMFKTLLRANSRVAYTYLQDHSWTICSRKALKKDYVKFECSLFPNIGC